MSSRLHTCPSTCIRVRARTQRRVRIHVFDSYMHVGVRARMHVCMYAFEHVCICACGIHACRRACKHERVLPTYLPAYLPACMRSIHALASLHTRIHACMHPCTNKSRHAIMQPCTHAPMHPWTNAHIRVCMHACICMLACHCLHIPFLHVCTHADTSRFYIERAMLERMATRMVTRMVIRMVACGHALVPAHRSDAGLGRCVWMCIPSVQVCIPSVQVCIQVYADRGCIHACIGAVCVQAHMREAARRMDRCAYADLLRSRGAPTSA
jgi:hypothetical protein